MKIEIESAKYTSSERVQFLAMIKVDDNEEAIPFYVSLENPDDSEAYKYIISQMNKKALVIEEPDDDTAIIANNMRYDRNRLLSETDYLVQPDYPLTEDQKKDILAYRQALRDVPEQKGFPRNIKWPEKPSWLVGK